MNNQGVILLFDTTVASLHSDRMRQERQSKPLTEDGSNDYPFV